MTLDYLGGTNVITRLFFFFFFITYIYSFSDSFPTQVITKYLIEFLVLYSRSVDYLLYM